MLTHGASVRTYVAWSEAVGLRAGDRYLCVYPFFHTAGLKSAVLASVIRGAALIPHAVFDVAEVMAKVAAERVTVLPGPPSVFQSILAHPGLEGFDLGSLRLAVTGAAVVPTEVVERMRSELHIDRVVTGYGLTETTGTVSMCRHDDPPEVIATTVGRPLPGVEILIVDDSKRSVVTGEAGEILVRGFNVMKGYFADPAATAAAVDRDGWLWTGDIGLIDAAGNLRITDRKKDMFIVGGFNAYPAEIEKMMTGHPDLSQVAVIGVPDERLGEVGAAYVVARPGAHPNSEELISWCRARMANFKVPRRVHLVDELPLTPSGKVMKHVLRQQAGPQPTVGGIPLSDDSLGRLLLDHPAAPTEPLVCTITSEMSKLEFCQAARSVAADLVRVGVRAGQAVAVQLPSATGTAAAMFGVWFAGAVFVPLNARQPPREVDRIVERIRPAAVLSGDGLKALVEPARFDLDTAFVTWTSGTTGPPRPILQTHTGYREILDRVLSSIRKGPVAARPSPNLIPVSLALNAGIYNLLFGLMAGAPVVLMERFVPEDFAALVARYEIRSTVLPPAAMTMLTDAAAVTDLSPLRYVRSITAPLSPLGARRFMAKFGVTVLNSYGQAEVGEVIGWTAADAWAASREAGCGRAPALRSGHQGRRPGRQVRRCRCRRSAAGPAAADGRRLCRRRLVGRAHRRGGIRQHR